MKDSILIVLTAFVFLYSLGTFADGDASSFQQNLDLKILEMEALVTEMEQQPDGWELRSIMQKHAQLMEASAQLASEAIEAEYNHGAVCLKRTAGEGTTEACCKSENLQRSWNRLLIVLLRHTIQRQNIILEKTGVFK